MVDRSGLKELFLLREVNCCSRAANICVAANEGYSSLIVGTGQAAQAALDRLI